tara:strand:- start:5368 stop:6582 length:1215 start_codon:yes stop_codon:yes gene_type:complete
MRPNLLLIGAQKSGTTSIATMLGTHRSVLLPPEKEVNFFSRPDWGTGLDAYYKRFPDRVGVQYWMDATPGYMWTETKYGKSLGNLSPMQHDIPSAIHDTLGTDIRIISTMRHPVKRAVSAFFHQFRMGRIGSGDRIRDIGHQYGIVDLGFYSEHLAAYRAIFPETAFKTLFFENYMLNTELVHRDIFLWLGLDPTNVRKEKAQNTALDTNAGMKLDYTGDSISVKGGMKQISVLAKNPNYKKMKVTEPPVVEQADLDYLNDIYANELECMAREYPVTTEIWPRRLTIETYNVHPDGLGNIKNQLTASQRIAESLETQIRQLLRLHDTMRVALQRQTLHLAEVQEAFEKIERDQRDRMSELTDITRVLSRQESRHKIYVEELKHQLEGARKNLYALRKQKETGAT